MIELTRYHRLKPKGLASASLDEPGMVCVTFKRFDVETGMEIPPEQSLLSFYELEHRQDVLKMELEVVQELLGLKKE